MRKVSKKTAYAFKCKRPLKVGNSCVQVKDNGDAIYRLHGNEIAALSDGKLYLSNCGWQTVTTKERLNAILETMGLTLRIYQKNFEWFVRDYVTGEVSKWNNIMEFTC